MENFLFCGVTFLWKYWTPVQILLHAIKYIRRLLTILLGNWEELLRNTKERVHSGVNFVSTCRHCGFTIT